MTQIHHDTITPLSFAICASVLNQIEQHIEATSRNAIKHLEEFRERRSSFIQGCLGVVCTPSGVTSLIVEDLENAESGVVHDANAYAITAGAALSDDQMTRLRAPFKRLIKFVEGTQIDDQDYVMPA